jgi:hypothetical protein
MTTLVAAIPLVRSPRSSVEEQRNYELLSLQTKALRRSLKSAGAATRKHLNPTRYRVRRAPVAQRKSSALLKRVRRFDSCRGHLTSPSVLLENSRRRKFSAKFGTSPLFRSRGCDTPSHGKCT